MDTHTTQPPFGQKSPQGQPALQAAPATRPGHTSHAQAERHEALWLSLTALHKDIVALGAKKPGAPVSEPVRIVAEGLLCDCVPFTRKRSERLPVAAADLAGLAVQLGQALAGLDAWESLHTSWDERFKCRIWTLNSGYLPIMRLKPPAAALKFERPDYADMRRKLDRHLEGRQRAAYQKGFEAGRAARDGAPEPERAAGEPRVCTPPGSPSPA